MPVDVVPVDVRTGEVAHQPGSGTSVGHLEVALCEGARAGEAIEEITLPQRVKALRRVADAIAAAPALAELADEETALGPVRLTGELARTAGQFRLCADVLEEGSLLEVTIDTRRAPGEPGGPRPEIRRTSVGIGLVAVFGASNFPLAFGAAGTDTASALAAGCAVIAKSHPLHPRTSEAAVATVRAALVECGWPAASLQLVHGVDVGAALVQDRRVQAGAFTGSPPGAERFRPGLPAPPPHTVLRRAGQPQPGGGNTGRGHGPGPPARALPGRVHDHGCRAVFTKPGPLPARRPPRPPPAAADAVTAQPPPSCPASAAQGFAAATAHCRPSRHKPATRGPTAARGPRGGPLIWQVPAATAVARPDEVLEECFGPTGVVVVYHGTAELLDVLGAVEGSLTISLHSEPDEAELARQILAVARRRTGRLLGAGVPTGVAVTWATHHGGPWPATTAPLHTSVGAHAVRRFLRPVAYQDMDQAFLPLELADHNPLGIVRRVDGRLTRQPLGAVAGSEAL